MRSAAPGHRRTANARRSPRSGWRSIASTTPRSRPRTTRIARRPRASAVCSGAAWSPAHVRSHARIFNPGIDGRRPATGAMVSSEKPISPGLDAACWSQCHSGAVATDHRYAAIGYDGAPRAQRLRSEALPQYHLVRRVRDATAASAVGCSHGSPRVQSAPSGRTIPCGVHAARRVWVYDARDSPPMAGTAPSLSAPAVSLPVPC